MWNKKEEIYQIRSKKARTVSTHSLLACMTYYLYELVGAVPIDLGGVSGETSGNDDPLFNEKNPRFKFNSE